MKSIDLFAGIGGIRLGFDNAFEKSIETVFVSEQDKFAQKTYSDNFKDDFPIAGDITKIDEKNIHMVTDEGGNKRIFVSGDITNTTNDIYGLPNIVIVSYDEHDNVLSRQAFVPPSTLLEPKTTVTFNHMLSVDPTHVKRLSVELKESK